MQAVEGGADFVFYNTDEIVDKDSVLFDRCICTPDAILYLKKIARILGPLGLFPNLKMNTIRSDIGVALSEFKKGKLDFRANGQNLNVAVGKLNLDKDKMLDHIKM